MTLDDILDVETRAEPRKVALWARLAIRAMRLACEIHGVDFGAIVRKEMARP